VDSSLQWTIGRSNDWARLSVGVMATRPDLKGGLLSGPIPVIVLAIVGGLMGYSNARQKAFLLRVQAQTLLCSAKIEENTRKQ